MTHRRRVLFLKDDPAYVVVFDDIQGEKPGGVSSAFWFPADADTVKRLQKK